MKFLAQVHFFLTKCKAELLCVVSILLLGNLYAQIGVSQVATESIAQQTSFQATTAVRTFFDANDCCKGGFVLPLELLAFDAKLDKANTVTLDWTTISEYNVSHFEVQHSSKFSTNSVFENVGKVLAKANSSERTHYRFLHKTPALGLNYYRLRMVDKDGSFEFSPIESVKITESAKVQVFPNPTHGPISFILGEDAILKQVSVYDQQGKLVKVLQPDALSLAELVSGIYRLQLHFENASPAYLDIVVAPK